MGRPPDTALPVGKPRASPREFLNLINLLIEYDRIVDGTVGLHTGAAVLVTGARLAESETAFPFRFFEKVHLTPVSVSGPIYIRRE